MTVDRTAGPSNALLLGKCGPENSHWSKQPGAARIALSLHLAFEMEEAVQTPSEPSDHPVS